ncbi:MAG: methionine--tRNA ligase [Nanoarchaeota archaeon]
MANKNTFYVTTPIYYPNDVPHLGQAYTTIAADTLARWHKLLGKEVFLLTGTDEHGKKIEETAQKAGKTPKTFVDHLIPEFKDAWKKLNIHYNRFIRTTDPDHEQVVQTLLAEIHKKGDIYEGYYEGDYCTGCEAYYTEKEAPGKICSIHNKPLDHLKEETYFFKLSKYQEKLLEFYKKNSEFISPKHRQKEIINRVKEGLQDLSITRTSFDWGIRVPFDKNHICYVWFDALTNYLTGIGYLEHKEQFKKFWPANVHIIGKDILWFHAVIWPAILLSAGITPPKKVFAHGWWTVHNEKMGKSAGNAIKIDQLIGLAGTDSARYFFLRAAPFGEDGDFSEQALIDRHNNELANKLGNLVSRLSTLAEQHGLTKSTSSTLDTKKIIKNVNKGFEDLAFDKVLNDLFGFIDKINTFLQDKKPWETHDSKILYQATNALKDITILLSPFLPETTEKIAKTFNFEISLESLKKPIAISKIKKAHILFKKIDMTFPPFKKQQSSVQKVQEKTSSTPKVSARDNSTPSQSISYDDFAKLDLRVGKIIEVKDHPQADKLYVLTVDLGEEKPRTIVAGLRLTYKKDELKGKQAIFVANLAPRALKGIESNGMILAASDDEDHLFFLTPEKDIVQGSKVK